ncbi:MAG: fatty acid desaturase [Lysobacteraceae bacterium]|nr:MAG: fatty acid desaturase [Xanthomonadaceae bacterium]
MATAERTSQTWWRQLVATYAKPQLGRSIWQIINSFVPYVGLWFLLVWSLEVSYWLTLLLAVIASGFLVRIFIILHDCSHGSFFRSRRANAIIGFLAGIVTFTPYHQWRAQHARHHVTSGDLDRRGTGDIWTLTVQEYLESTRLKRIAYRLTRNPVFLFVIGPLYMFLIHQRFPSPAMKKRDRMFVHLTNLCLVAVATSLSLLIGFKTYVLIQLPLLTISSAFGLWLFYVQHQFDGVYWKRKDDWSYADAALKGSSYYKLPGMLQWFSGNIGFHHLHHLSASIPNYNLQRCHEENPEFGNVTTLTLRSSLKSLSLRLWDEESGRLIGYRELRRIKRGLAAMPADASPS